MAQRQEPTADLPALDDRRAAELARVALRNLRRPYPYKPAWVHVGPASARTPREAHPVFWGSFDWHSSVHGHWMLVRLLALRPDHAAAADSRALLDAQLTEAGLAAEAAFFEREENHAFERMYGWAWVFRLAAELEAWDDAQGALWREHVRPLESRLAERTLDHLPRLAWPIRSGLHGDTGFALSQVLDWARVVEHRTLEIAAYETACRHYRDDREAPAGYEPSGQDFFSTILNEADLMRRVLAPEDFSGWLAGFLPGLARGEVENLLVPVDVADRSDPLLVHLAGLNLSRAWALRGIASALGEDDPRRAVCARAAVAHAGAGLREVATGSYAGEHWLASFATYLLGGSGIAGSVVPGGADRRVSS